MKSKDQQLLEEAYSVTILKENNSDWKDAPDSLGWWWFYGDVTYGAILDKPAQKELHCVPVVHKMGETFISPYKGMMWYIKPYDPKHSKRLSGREGYLGYWKKCDLPQLPEWKLEFN